MALSGAEYDPFEGFAEETRREESERMLLTGG